MFNKTWLQYYIAGWDWFLALNYPNSTVSTGLEAGLTKLVLILKYFSPFKQCFQSRERHVIETQFHLNFVRKHSKDIGKGFRKKWQAEKSLLTEV